MALMRPPTSVNPEKMDPAEVEQAAQELGLKALKVPRLLAYGTLGKFLREIGVKNYSHGLFIHNAEQIQVAMTHLQEEIADTDDTELKLAMMTLHAKYARTMTDLAKAMSDVGDLDQPQDAVGAGLGPPPAQNINIGVRVDTTGKVGSVEVESERNA